MATLAGKWRLASSEFFEEYMKAIGVGLMTRKMAGTLKPSQEICIDGDKWQIKTISTFKSSDLSFTLGTEFDETTADGRKVKSTCILDEDKLIHTSKADVPTTITRQVVEDMMVMTLSAKDIVCTRKYQRDD